jgi:hypothetical protein
VLRRLRSQETEAIACREFVWQVNDCVTYHWIPLLLNILTLNPVLNHFNPVHNLGPCFHKILLNAIPWSTSGSATLSLSRKFLYRQYGYFFHCSRTHYIPDISRPHRFDHGNGIWWKNTNLEAHHCAVSFIVLLLHYLWVEVFLLAACSDTSSVCDLYSACETHEVKYSTVLYKHYFPVRIPLESRKRGVMLIQRVFDACCCYQTLLRCFWITDRTSGSTETDWYRHKNRWSTAFKVCLTMSNDSFK